MQAMAGLRQMLSMQVSLLQLAPYGLLMAGAAPRPQAELRNINGTRKEPTCPAAGVYFCLVGETLGAKYSNDISK